LRRPRLKPEQALYGLSPPKLALEGIEHETSRGANSKIPSQPLVVIILFHFGLLKNIKFKLKFFNMNCEPPQFNNSIIFLKKNILSILFQNNTISICLPEKIISSFFFERDN